jgi:hypothetical protein
MPGPMHAEPISIRYVAVLQVPGGARLFCSDRHRDEWTSRIGFAETYRALYEALEVASRHGGQALTWQEACEVSVEG